MESKSVEEKGFRVLRKRSGFMVFGLSLLAFGLLIALVACQGPNAANSSNQPLLEQIGQRKKIIAGVKFDSKPFGYLDTDGKLKGYDIDLMREIAKRVLGSPDAVEFQQVLSSTRIIAIDSGNIDVVAATMTITPEREEMVDFSEPYYVAGQAVLVPNNSSIHQVADLQNKRVLFIMGTTSEANLKKRVPHAKYVGFKTTTDAFSALKAGRGDALTTDDTILAGLAAGDCQFRLLPERLSKEPYGLGIRQDVKHHSTDSFRTAINEALESIQKDGTLEKLRARWIGFEQWSKGC